MKKILAIVLTAILVVYVLAILVPIDPEEQRPGTRLAGDLGSASAWSSVTATDYGFGERLVHLETRPWYRIRHSVTTTISVRDGKVFIPCARCSGKTWPNFVASDPSVRLRIDGVVFECTATRVSDMGLLQSLAEGSRIPPEDVWVYELTHT